MKHSPSDIDVEVDNLLLPAPKRKGGNWHSGLFLDVIEFVECPFVRGREGRTKIDFLRLPKLGRCAVRNVQFDLLE